jgi:hypothetical protein
MPQLLDAIKTAGLPGQTSLIRSKEILPLLDAVDPETSQISAITVAIAPDGHTTRRFDRCGWRRSFEKTSAGTALAQPLASALVAPGVRGVCLDGSGRGACCS